MSMEDQDIELAYSVVHLKQDLAEGINSLAESLYHRCAA
jgi:hypothetical protein